MLHLQHISRTLHGASIPRFVYTVLLISRGPLKLCGSLHQFLNDKMGAQSLRGTMTAFL